MLDCACNQHISIYTYTHTHIKHKELSKAFSVQITSPEIMGEVFFRQTNLHHIKKIFTSTYKHIAPLTDLGRVS